MPIQVAVVLLGLVCGAGLARYTSGAMPWDAVGVVIAAAGMVVLGLVNRGELEPVALCMAIVAGGAAFALSCGMARATGLPSGPAGAALGMAALLLCAQAIGQETVRDRVSGGGLVLPAISTLAALAVAFLARPVVVQGDDEPAAVTDPTGA
jgi:hypothetical protein